MLIQSKYSCRNISDEPVYARHQIFTGDSTARQDEPMMRLEIVEVQDLWQERDEGENFKKVGKSF